MGPIPRDGPRPAGCSGRGRSETQLPSLDAARQQTFGGSGTRCAMHAVGGSAAELQHEPPSGRG
ncbi:hypothetical protein A33M_2847 [Rhodovulum sp. PH10]|nr:hypothetical protein A33M_2847 [Rhodovulum sp. PH10]